MFEELRDADALTLRVWQSLPHERLDELEANGMTSGDGDDFLRVGYVKVFMDGTLGSRTARLLDGSGVEITSPADFVDILARAARAGFPVAVDAIGDQANRDALDGFAATQNEWRRRGLRQRIEDDQTPGRRRRRALRRYRRYRVGAVRARRRRPRPRRSLLGRRDRSRLLLPLAARRRRGAGQWLRDAAQADIELALKSAASLADFGCWREVIDDCPDR